jgi:FixJ family two-component response regulator
MIRVDWPVIVITGHGDVAVAVHDLHKKRGIQ